MAEASAEKKAKETKVRNGEKKHETAAPTTSSETDPAAARKKVRFDRLQEAARLQRIKDKENPPEDQFTGRVKVKSSPLRDISIFVGALAFLLFAALQFDSDAYVKKNKRHTKAEKARLQRMTESLSSLVSSKKAPRETPCDIFLDPSTIPEGGLSLFAGRDYLPGDLLLETHTLLPLYLNNESSVLVSPFAFLLKHRPNDTNVEGRLLSDGPAATTDLEPFQLRASTKITAGDELFVPFDQHPHSQLQHYTHAFDNLPLQQQYDKARAIETDLLSSLRRHAAGQRGGGGKPMDQNFVLRLAKNAVSQVDVMVGRLLPSTKHELDVRAKKKAPLWTAFSSKSVSSLEEKAKCLTDVRIDSSSGTAKTQATKSFRKGEMVLRAPLHVIPRPRNCKKNDCDSSNCFGHKESPYLFCPLTAAGFISHDPKSKDDNVNVEFQWSSTQMRLYAVDTVLGSAPGSLVWNVVALRNIEAGEELRIRGGSKKLPNIPVQGVLKNELLGDQWLQEL